MHGFSLTLPSPFGGKANLPRSLSSPVLPDFSRSQLEFDTPKALPDEVPRSASYTSLPIFDFNHESEEGCQATEVSTQAAEESAEKQLQHNVPEKCLQEKEEKPVQRRKSIIAGTRDWIQRVKSGRSEQHNTGEQNHTTPNLIPPVPSYPRSGSVNKSHRVSGSFTTLAHRSWISPTKSPPKKMEKTTKYPDKNKSKKTYSTIHNSNSMAEIKTPSQSTFDLLTVSDKMDPQMLSERPNSVCMSSSVLDSSNSSTSSLPRSSLDNQSTPRTSTDKVPPLPINLSIEKLGHFGTEGPWKRDDLWSAFRALDNDFSKFQSKSWSLKTNVVRASLIPFLKSHPGNASINNLRPEDLERRINVFNKWWTGLLEVLDGRHNQTVSGVDRPVLLQGCFEIMIRPEWRLSPSSTAFAERSSARPSRRISLAKRCSASLTSTTSTTNSPMMAESINQSIRSIFVQNLLQQINFVVDKMSLRYAPASLVTFCGKAAAYAFFFVPGVAEILVRIWKLQPRVLRRVSDELGITRKVADKLSVDDIVSSFPAHIQCLGWSSFKSMSNFLRQTPSMPVMAEKIPWYGPWVARWCGRDSDLFFIFVKHYHILIEEFFTSGLTLGEKARAPGYLLVLAQTLTAIDATIHRQPVSDPLPITFDDVLAGADASATALPIPSNNSARFMAENRLIMLLRDFLCENPSENEQARITFGQAFGKMMQAGAKRTSLFDHSACFVLCDFMEEALIIYSRFSDFSKFIDWNFWFDVCKRMLKSENTMSEIRIFAFIYSIWNIVTADERRKEIICFEWLLTEEVFEKYFNHWCPMIRAYFMRLICWRVCRNDGESTDLDTKIFNEVSIRIKSIWNHFICLKDQAESNNSLPPSTVPCLPAPGRRLLIIRNDNQSSVSPLFFGLDGFAARNPSRKTNRKISPTNFNMTEFHPTDPKLDLLSELSLPAPNKKRWSFIGRIFSFPFFSSSSSTNSNNSVETPPITRSLSTRTISIHPPNSSDDDYLTQLQNNEGFEESENISEEIPKVHRAFSFKFSLEGNSHFEHGGIVTGSIGVCNNLIGGPQAISAGINSVTGSALCERKLSSPRLPAPAQAWLAAKSPISTQDIIPRVRPTSQNNDNSRSKIAADFAPGHLNLNFECRSSINISNNFSTKKYENITQTDIYMGRSLAEWSIVVGECNGFLERRRSEGVPNLKMVEVPTLGVEGLRRFG